MKLKDFFKGKKDDRLGRLEEIEKRQAQLRKRAEVATSGIETKMKRRDYWADEILDIIHGDGE